jgi:hypothetical protein
MKGEAMERNRKQQRQWGWVMGLLAIGCVLLLLACGQESGQKGGQAGSPTGGQAGSLANKPPPSLGAIANVDGSDETKKDEKKPQAGAEQTPAQSPAEAQPAQAAPKQ